MNLRKMIPPSRIGTPATIKRVFRLAAVAALALGLAPSRAAAQSTLACPGTISSDYTLSADIVANTSDTSPCITVNGVGLTIDLAGYNIDVSALGNGAVAIQNGSSINTTIVGHGGSILTAYSSAASDTTGAIEASGGSGLTVTGVNIFNQTTATTNTGDTAAALCASPSLGGPSVAKLEEYGSGISLTGVTGATISGNNVCFYQYGISVQDSAIPSNSSGSISGNTLNLDMYYMYASSASTETYSAGVVLSNSSGWTVSGNTVGYDGAISLNGTCAPPTSTTGVNTCSFGLQVINSSSSNSVSSNTVEGNFVGGIYTGVDTSGNKITGNTSLGNFWDMWDDAPLHSNAWHHNTCHSEGGTLPSHTCHD
jgi:parallel beta-helix repeat protein